MFQKSRIEPLQEALKSLGLYDGNIDGIVGPLTLGAIRKFEALALEKPVVDKLEPHEPAENPDTIDNVIDGKNGANIEDALAFTLKNEGGFTDNPADKGGPTNKGITIGRLSEYLGRKATKDEVKNLDFGTIKNLFVNKLTLLKLLISLFFYGKNLIKSEPIVSKAASAKAL
jgi:hypothetical protein